MIGQNREGDVAKCKALFDAAKLCGASAVKLQKRDNRTLYTRDMYDEPYNSENAYAPSYGLHREFLEFDRDQYVELHNYARQIGITMFSTAWDIPSADLLNEIGMPAFKIASGDLRTIPLIKHIARFGKPMLLSTGGGPGGGPGLTIELSHRDVDVLNTAAGALGEVLEQFPIVQDVDAGSRAGKTQYNIRVREAGRSLGLTARDIANQVRAAFLGAEVLRQQNGRNELRVLVRLPENEREREGDVGSLLVRTPAGTYVPLDTVASLERAEAPTSINRRNGRRTLQVTAVVTPSSEAGQVLNTVVADNMPALQRSFPGLGYSLEGRQAEMRESIRALGWGLLAAVGVIYALLAVPFRSYIQPVIVLFAIPFGIFGAVIGHLIMGYSMSVISVMGVIALAGVVVNDALVMVHFANSRRIAGDSAYQAIATAGARRFRPILLTTLSTFGGLAPMIFETSRQAQFMIPMAISMGYGIIFATGITLFLVPCLYLIVEDGLNLFRANPGVQPSPEQA